MATTATTTPAIGVLDADGLHLTDKPLVPIAGAIRHVGDLYKGARRHNLTQLWLTDAWVRAAGLPVALNATGRFREVRHPFVSDSLAELHAFPDALGPWLALRRKGEAGSGVSVVFPLYDEHGVWGRETDGATLLAALLAYAGAVGTPYYSSPGRTGTDLLQELGKRGAGSQREFADAWPSPALEADTVKELSWLRTLSPDERQRATSTRTTRTPSGSRPQASSSWACPASRSGAIWAAGCSSTRGCRATGWRALQARRSGGPARRRWPGPSSAARPCRSARPTCGHGTGGRWRRGTSGCGRRGPRSRAIRHWRGSWP